MRETEMVGGVLVFRRNLIVRLLLHTSTLDFNAIVAMYSNGMVTGDDMKEFCQLAGYDVDGYYEIFPDEEEACE